METMEIFLWMAMIKEAKKGNEGARAMLAEENKLRKENNRPTVEEELMAIAKKSLEQYHF